ncbi:MAG TPA: tetratricopeptide repeat protein [Gemmatimonadales bacterium]|jgi:tetratricopeptide (TPR) repeat protein|nr:tetratricopeptide repeat protein [Gemmatimonadales bacterium]
MTQRLTGLRSRSGLALAVAALSLGHGLASAQSGGGAGKIAVTTSSVEARQLYLKGRAMGENLRAHDSREILKQAAAKDPQFALAHYSLALNSPTAKEFFEHLKQAVALSAKASEGERLMILGLQAGANADTKTQRDYYEKLAAAYPGDERAHFLLGGAYFGQQDYPKAIAEYHKSVELAPDYAPAYNLLGYAHRQAGQPGEAEQAFKKYIELIPTDPNPYDSYAELLMKLGRFEESVAMYRKALATDQNFSPSRIGVATNMMYRGDYDGARVETGKLYQLARNDGDRRASYFTNAVVYSDEGNFDRALAELRKEYAVAEKIHDAAAMAGDVTAMGDVLLEAGKPEDARKSYEQALELQEHSDLSPEVKEDARLVHHYNLGRVAVRAGDLAGARQHADAFMKGVTAKKNDGEVRLAHQLAGTIALEQKQFDQAIAELTQGNQQDAYTLYRLGLAYQGKGDGEKAAGFFRRAADQNSLPALNYAFVRLKAKKMKA